MARNSKVNQSKRSPRAGAGAKGGRVRRGRPKICIFCAEHATWVDYKDIALLRRFLSDRGKIKARGATGTCAQHQRDVAVAIKTARELALLPYSLRTVAAEPGNRRGGRGRPADRSGEERPSAGDGASTSEERGDAAENDSDEAELDSAEAATASS